MCFDDLATEREPQPGALSLVKMKGKSAFSSTSSVMPVPRSATVSVAAPPSAELTVSSTLERALLASNSSMVSRSFHHQQRARVKLELETPSFCGERCRAGPLCRSGGDHRQLGICHRGWEGGGSNVLRC